MARTIQGLVLFGTILAGAVTADEVLNQLTPEEIHDGWVLLFDGQTKFGWKAENAKFEDDWYVEDGILTCKTESPFNHIKSNAAFADFILKLDFRVNTKGNSGVFFRGGLKGLPFVTPLGVTGYEAQIDDNDGRGLKYQTGGLYDVAAATKLIPGENEWRSYEIMADGDRIVTKINGEVVCDTHQTKYRWGHIGLQQHNPGSKIEFRNIKLKPLGLKPIFNGENLSGWKVVSRDPSAAKLQAEWSVQDGMIHVEVPKKAGIDSGGQGQLETEGDYKDFILQLDIRANGTASKPLNSGVFFRSLPDTCWVGYESQIRNQYMANHRERPIDYGTGGIYNLKPTRRVNTDEGKFFKKTLLAQGRYMAVWLDGYQVTDFFDEREPNPNPREGFYDGAGKIALQSHDPTTNLDFKNIQIGELPTER